MDIKKINPELRQVFRFVPGIPFHRPWVVRLMNALTGSAKPRAETRDGVVYGQAMAGTVPVLTYQPEGGHSGGALIWVHGGGYLVGTARQDDDYAVRFAKELNIMVVSVDYRLAGEAPFPAPLDDCFAAWSWLLNSAADLGVDPARILIGGESAGGGLAATLVQRIASAGGPQPVGQVLLSPMLDDRTATNRALDDVKHKVWNNKANYAGWKTYLNAEPGADALPPFAAAARAGDISNLPPTWLGVGDADLFFEEGQAYATRLAASGVECEFLPCEGAPHTFNRIVPNATVSKAYMDGAMAFMARCLSAAPS